MSGIWLGTGAPVVHQNLTYSIPKVSPPRAFTVAGARPHLDAGLVGNWQTYFQATVWRCDSECD